MINDLAKKIHKNNIEKGFYEKEKNIGEMLCLIHSEVSEALEADRIEGYYDSVSRVRVNKKFNYNGSGYGWSFDIVDSSEEAWLNWFREEVKNSFQDELADIMIRVMDLAEFKGIDLEKHIEMKMRYNSLREKYHGKKY